MNPRYPFGVYTISNRARSASYATSPYASTFADLHIVHHGSHFVKHKFYFFQKILQGGFSPCKTVLVGKLAVIKACIEAVAFQQFPVISLLHDMTVPHHQDHIRFPDGA